MAEGKLTWADQIKRAVPIGSIVYIILLAVYLGSYTVNWTSNEYTMNRTNPDTNLTEQVAFLHYAKADSVPIRNFGDNTVKSHFGLEQLSFAIVSLIVFLFIINKSKQKDDLIAEDVYKQWLEDKLRDDKTINKFKVHEDTSLQYSQLDDGQSAPWRRQLWAEIHSEEEGHRHKCYIVNPYKFQIYDVLTTETYYGGQLKCDICGKYPDVKILSPKGFEEMKQKFGFTLKKQ